jgi:hypothetical protein
MSLSPIVVFAYNRPHYLQETLISISKNSEASESLLYIYCDGPKPNCTEADLQLIKEARSVARKQQWCKEVVIVESESNKGLSNAIISGVTELVAKHGKIIVLEDDLVTSPFFLQYINSSLDKYEDKDEVISVVGYMYPVVFKNVIADTLFVRNADCLGWATWKRGWDLFEKDASILVNKIEKLDGAEEDFNFHNQYSFMKALRLVAEGKLNSWAVRWYASCFVNNKVSIFPKESLVRHIGNMGSNVKANNDDFLGSNIRNKPIEIYCEKIEEDPENRMVIAKHFRKYNRRRISLSTIKYIFKRFVFPKFFK